MNMSPQDRDLQNLKDFISLCNGMCTTSTLTSSGPTGIIHPSPTKIGWLCPACVPLAWLELSNASEAWAGRSQKPGKNGKNITTPLRGGGVKNVSCIFEWSKMRVLRKQQKQQNCKYPPPDLLFQVGRRKNVTLHFYVFKSQKHVKM